MSTLPATIPPANKTAVTVPSKTNEVSFVPFGENDEIKLNLNIIKNYVAIPTKNKNLPDDRECMKFMMLCRSRKLNPFEGDCFLMGYEARDGGITWSLITAHQAFLKRAEVHKEFNGFESGVIVREGEDGDIKEREGDFLYPGDILLGGWATVHFKGRQFPMKRRLNLKSFSKPYGRWNEDPAGMIVKCAEADALRSSFPTLLGSLYTDNERPIIEIASSAKAPDLGPAAAQITQGSEPAKTAGEQPKTAQEPSGGVTTPAGGESAPRAQAGEPEKGDNAPQGSAEPSTGTPEGDALASVRRLMSKSGVVEEQVMQYCRANNGMAKENQKKLSELSTAKLQTLSKAWHNILPKIREYSLK